MVTATLICVLLRILLYRYVETLKGRKRFLAKIKFGNSEEKSRAQRQAVNSICQVVLSLSLGELGMLVKGS